jgi:hypothetical protein
MQKGLILGGKIKISLNKAFFLFDLLLYLISLFVIAKNEV